jgi:hypothetical protein
MRKELFFAYPELVNTTVNWLPMDTQKLFSRNKKKKGTLAQLKKNNWLDYNIEYKFNSKGFRCIEFSNKPSIIFLGCSYTMGIGLNLHDTFSHHVSEKLSLVNYNLGLAGGSNSACFRFGYYWIPKIKPKIVIQMATFKERFEVMKNDYVDTFLGTEKNARYWVENSLNAELDFVKCTAGIKSICEENDVKFLQFTVEDDLLVNNDKKDLARDLAHVGSATHEKTADQILNKIDSLTN